MSIEIISSNKNPHEIEEIRAEGKVLIEKMGSDMVWFSIGDEHFCISNRHKDGVMVIRTSKDEYPKPKNKKKKKKVVEAFIEG